MSGNNPEILPMSNFNNRDVSYTDSRMLAIFQECDTNGDGYICLDELDNYINSHEDQCSFIPKKVLKKVHKKADTDGDKKLNYDEFVELLQDWKFQRLLQKSVSTYIHHLIPHPQKAESPFQLRSARIGGVEEKKDLCDEYSCCPPPMFMLVISLLEFALFITDELTKEGSTLTASGVTAQYLLYDPAKKNEVWRFVTYMFVHIGYTHIIMNLIVQLFLGIPLEMVNKWWRVLTVYFLGGIAGSLAHSIIDGNIRLGGASGGVYALMTAHLAQVIMNRDSLKYASVQLIVFTLMTLADLGPAIYQRYFLNEVTEIGVTCHLGGAVAGLLVGIYILRNIDKTTNEKYIWWAALVIYLLLTGGAIMAVIFL